MYALSGNLTAERRFPLGVLSSKSLRLMLVCVRLPFTLGFTETNSNFRWPPATASHVTRGDEPSQGSRASYQQEWIPQTYPMVPRPQNDSACNAAQWRVWPVNG